MQEIWYSPYVGLYRLGIYICFKSLLAKQKNLEEDKFREFFLLKTLMCFIKILSFS
jgi:hypothetical protein